MCLGQGKSPRVLLLEHDAKELVGAAGVPIPQGVFVTSGTVDTAVLPGEGPWVVKAQVGVGGRGKAGGVGFADTREEVAAFVRETAGRAIKGHAVQGFRVERRVAFVRECYLSFALDAAARQVRVLLSAEGGVEVEAHAGEGAMLSTLAPPEAEALTAAARGLVRRLPQDLHPPLEAAVTALAAAFLDTDATLLEVNPLFVLADGGWTAGDMKFGVDESALVRQPALEAAIRARPAAYREADFKLSHGFDYVVVDPEGDIGLLTTGAGLSMMLIDEMRQAGRRPYNFCDVRTGMLRGSPQRLIDVLQALREGRRIRVVFVNIFAGITDLGEFADLLVQALDAVPELDAPVVARLIGNNLEAARARLERHPRIVLETGLEAALQLAADRAGGAA